MMLQRLFGLVAIGIVILVIFSSGGSPVAARAKWQADIPDELLKQRIQSARAAYTQKLADAKTVAFDEKPIIWSERWLDAELAVCEKPADRIALFKAHLQRAKELEALAISLAKAEKINEGDVQAAKYFRIEAEISLLQAKNE